MSEYIVAKFPTPPDSIRPRARSMASGRSQKYYYNPAGVAYNAAVTVGKLNGFSPAHTQAAARAVLRHGRHNDGLEGAARACIIGLHPMFFGLHNAAGLVDNPNARKELLHDTLTDALDAVSENFQGRGLTDNSNDSLQALTGSMEVSP